MNPLIYHPWLPARASRHASLLATLLCAGLLGACASASPPATIVEGPLTAVPLPPPASLERVHTGSLFLQGASNSSLFSGRRKPRQIGDTLKVEIAENFSANSTVNADSSRDSSLKSKGPGNSNSPSSLIQGLLNQDITASGSNSFKGAGTDKTSSSFSGQLAASVVGVLSNGNLVVAGERRIALNGGVSSMRFSGVVDPMDLNESNVVASKDVVNARLEVVGKGDMTDSATRTWLQRVLSNTLSVW